LDENYWEKNKMRLFDNLNINFLGKRKIAYIVSSLFIILSIISFIIRGFEYGIDFKGGLEIAFDFEKPIKISELRELSKKWEVGKIELKTFGGETGVLLRTDELSLSQKSASLLKEKILSYIKDIPFEPLDTTFSTLIISFSNVSDTRLATEILTSKGFQVTNYFEDETEKTISVRIGIAEWIKEQLMEQVPDNKFTVLKEEMVGPKIGEELKRDAFFAILFSLIVILVYLGFRFKFIFAIGAVVALFHDVIITLGLFSLFYGVFPGLNLEINLTVIAAFLTLVGYSINDTVVVFDRIREYLKIHKTLAPEIVMNNAINRTMNRTILTSLTTLITVIILLIFGGEVLRTFAFTLFFGILIGTYSSIFIASALALDYAKKNKKSLMF
jgi:preprotein translocase SecF subunit